MAFLQMAANGKVFIKERHVRSFELLDEIELSKI